MITQKKGRTKMKTDIEIAQEAEMLHIKDVAAQYGITEDDLDLYGKYKAKLSNEFCQAAEKNENGKLVLMTAINPTPAGEGKTTTSIGLGDALTKLGKKTLLALRAFSRTMLRHQGWRCRRRLCPGRSDGGFESAFYR